MKSNFFSVPFTADSNQGFSKSTGMAKFSPAGVVIEFNSKTLGFGDGKVKEVRVSLEEILDIKFRRGIFGFFSSIQLRLKTIAKLAELPSENGKVKLKIKREDFNRAQEAVERTLRFMNADSPEILPEAAELSSQIALPPAQTSVNELFDTEKLDQHSGDD